LDGPRGGLVFKVGAHVCTPAEMSASMWEWQMDNEANTATRYRQRAEELRLIAESARDAKTRKLLQGVAEDYERMAETSERIAQSDRSRARRI
jgi:hypothetical protein